MVGLLVQHAELVERLCVLGYPDDGVFERVGQNDFDGATASGAAVARV